jgi:hypothetical protein
MTKDIKISDAIFERLQRLAAPLIDTPESVILRLLDRYESPSSEGSSSLPSSLDLTAAHRFIEDPLERESRQRGVVVKLGEVTIRAISVSDLYTETLKYLHQKGFLDKVKQHIPLATSKQRYLIAESPVHPNGKEFVVPVEYKGYYMEAHKDYKNGIRHLCKMLDFCGVTLTYLG